MQRKVESFYNLSGIQMTYTEWIIIKVLKIVGEDSGAKLREREQVAVCCMLSLYIETRIQSFVIQ